MMKNNSKSFSVIRYDFNEKAQAVKYTFGGRNGSKWLTHLVYAQICVSPVRRAFEGFASISEAHVESFCAPNE